MSLAAHAQQPHPLLSDHPYDSPRDHLEDYFEGLRLALERHALRESALRGQPVPLSRRQYHGLLAGLDAPAAARLRELHTALAELRARIRSRAAATARVGKVELPLCVLEQRFGLPDDAVMLLVAAAAPQIHPGFQRVYAQHDDAQRSPQCNVSFLCQLLADDYGDHERLIVHLDGNAPLVLWKLLELASAREWLPESPLIYRRVRVPDRIISFCTGRPQPLEYGLPSFASVRIAGQHEPEVLMPEGPRAALQRLLAPGAERSALPMLVGPHGCGKKALALAVLAQTGHGAVVVDLEQAPAAADDLGRHLAEVAREALLRGAALYLDHCHCLLAHDAETGAERPETRSRLQLIARTVAQFRGPVVLASDEPAAFVQLGRLVPIDIRFPSTETQRSLWLQWLPPELPLGAEVDLDSLLARYSLSGGGIRAAIEQATSMARTRAPDAPVLELADLVPALRRQLTHRLGGLAEVMETPLSWRDLVLDPETKDRVLELLAFARNRDAVMTRWGFGKKLVYGRGMSALFAGPPGTGKTMVATLIAKELGLELFRVDLSKVVSKYIGETEKNLSRVFREARRGQVVLLFDEADSLFAKRTEVRSSHDRYANLEVNFLLQQVESYDGVLILTTNFEKGIDEAFKRRIRLRVNFPFPDDGERERLWRSMFPPEVECAPDVDLQELGRRFRLTGGHIKNAVLRAAFLAYDQGSPLDRACLIRGAELEWQEMGHLLSDPASQASRGAPPPAPLAVVDPEPEPVDERQRPESELSSSRRIDPRFPFPPRRATASR